MLFRSIDFTFHPFFFICVAKPFLTFNRMMSIKQDHEQQQSQQQQQDPMLVGEDGIVAGLSVGGTEPRPPTLQVEPTYSDNYVLDGQHMISESRMRDILMELQQRWLKEYEQSREKLLVELTEKLHQEYLTDLQRKQTEYMAQCREEMEAERVRQDELFQRRLQEEVQRLTEKQRREIQLIKKKQWCWQCEKEAIYHCCWNTAYCTVECQQAHWPMHRRVCRRKKTTSNAQSSGQNQQQNNRTTGNSGGAATNSATTGAGGNHQQQKVSAH